jgi:transposase
VQQEHIARFIGIPGHEVGSVYFLNAEGRSTEADKDVERVVIEMKRTGRRFHCPCGRQWEQYYDYREQFVRDLPWGPWPKVDLLVPRFRVQCPQCGVKTEPLDWIEPKHRHTRRLAEAVALACREVRSIRAIAEAFHLGWDLVKKIDKVALSRELNPPEFTGLRHLAIDEFSIKRRHTYGTIFLDVERNRVLWVCATREKEAVVEVFQKVFGPEICAQIEAVSMDWWEGYEGAVRECLPNAKIVWDFFHVVKKYNHEVLDRVRLDESLRYQDREERLAFKQTKFLLLKNRRNLVSHELARLRQLLQVNRRLLTVYLLRDGLRRLWDYRYAEWASRWFASWYGRAIRSRIGPLKRFARSLKERLDGVLAHCQHPINSGVLEGINNKVKVIKRVAYGFRDQAYFFLKIRAHFTGVDPL